MTGPQAPAGLLTNLNCSLILFLSIYVTDWLLINSLIFSECWSNRCIKTFEQVMVDMVDGHGYGGHGG